jgi:hypothetical protein
MAVPGSHPCHTPIVGTDLQFRAVPQIRSTVPGRPSSRHPFVGQHGRFTAFRGYQCSPSTPWWAHRQIHNHSHKHRLGTTASVTIECLELAASSLQALVK